MKSSLEITREEWMMEMEKRSPSTEVFDAYVEIEQYVVGNTKLLCTFRRNLRGKSHFATFNASVCGRFSLVQIYDGSCFLMYKWTTPTPGITVAQIATLNESLERFRTSLGVKSDAYSKARVLSIGASRIKEAIVKASDELITVAREF